MATTAWMKRVILGLRPGWKKQVIFSRRRRWMNSIARVGTRGLNSFVLCSLGGMDETGHFGAEPGLDETGHFQLASGWMKRVILGLHLGWMKRVIFNWLRVG